MLFFPLIATADALPAKLRLRILRFFGPTILGCMCLFSVVLRLPTSEHTPGKLVWTVMGTDTVTNLQALTYSSTVMAALLAKGVLRAWLYPDRLSFISTSLSMRVCDGVGPAPAANAVVPTPSVERAEERREGGALNLNGVVPQPDS